MLTQDEGNVILQMLPFSSIIYIYIYRVTAGIFWLSHLIIFNKSLLSLIFNFNIKYGQNQCYEL